MEVVLIQGKGEDRMQLSVNVSEEVADMMQAIEAEGKEDWTDRGFELYRAAERRLNEHVDEDALAEKLDVVEAQQQKKKKHKMTDEEIDHLIHTILMVILGIIGVALIVAMIVWGPLMILFGVGVLGYVLSEAGNSMFGKGK